MSRRLYLRHKPSGQELIIAKLFDDGSPDWVGCDKEQGAAFVKALWDWCQAHGDTEDEWSRRLDYDLLIDGTEIEKAKRI